MNDTTWMESLKPGDQVVRHWSNWGNRQRLTIQTIARVTRTQVVLADDTHWYIKNEKRVGAGSDGWGGGEWLAPFDNDARVALAKQMAEDHIDSMAGTLSRVQWHKLPHDVLERVMAIVEEG